jgi:hypothetical protein
MRTLCCALSLVTMVALAGAQEKQIPQNVLEDIARDLAVLQSEVIKTGEEQRAELALSYKHPVAVNINKPADVRTGADKNADVSFKVSPGTTLPVVDKVNDWYAVKDKSNKVGWVNASDVTPVTTPPPLSADEKFFRNLTEKISKMRDKYKDNPYVLVKGFSVTLSIPPSVTLDLEFK